MPGFLFDLIILFLIAMNFLHIFPKIVCIFGANCADFWATPSLLLPIGSSIFDGG